MVFLLLPPKPPGQKFKYEKPRPGESPPMYITIDSSNLTWVTFYLKVAMKGGMGGGCKKLNKIHHCMYGFEHGLCIFSLNLGVIGFEIFRNVGDLKTIKLLGETCSRAT